MTEQDPRELAAGALERIRADAPLVHNITNYVVMNYTANALLALGASPVMAHAAEEVAEMAGLASAQVLNIGTLSGPWVEAMLIAGRAANNKGIPVVLDPVGSGATRMRTAASKRILDQVRVAVLRGNASEILSLAPQGARAETRGVDSIADSLEARAAAEAIAASLGVTVAITGATDVVTDGQRTLLVRNGHPLMGRVTGSGCTASAVVGAFCAVQPDPLWATACGLGMLGLAGQWAAGQARQPGSFGVALLDGLAAVGPAELRADLRVERV